MAKIESPAFTLSEVSETRKKYLLRWRLERKLDLELREAQAEQEQSLVAERGLTRYGSSFRPFDTDVREGDIRLLRQADVPDFSRFLYIAVLYVRDNFTSVVAPFSSYSVPACKDEWLTGLASEPLKVLQLWNAQPVATKDIAQSWRTHTLDEGLLSQARMLYRHAVDGSWPQGQLREQVGLAILNPADERLAYQHEELVLFTGLRKRLSRVSERADSLAKQTVQFTPGGALAFPDTGHVYEKPDRLAADSGDVFAEVIVLCGEGEPVTAKARREADATHKTVRWHLDGCAVPLLPGLPACLYAFGRKKPLNTAGQTVGDGSVVAFKAESEMAFSRLLADAGLWIVIQSE
ncbi:MAG: hypothetical protein PHV28_17950 [Kiritimatiellae bacterium]|nr:hypothetical protein [Kiritimatiellia bacterium]